MAYPANTGPLPDDLETKAHKIQVENAYDSDEKTRRTDLLTDAYEAENVELKMGVIQAVKAYPMASLWAFVFSSTIIMEAYCVFLAGNFIALPAFQTRYGVYNAEKDQYVIETSWQSALQFGGPIGALIGVVIAGPITSRIGYRWAFISNLMLLNAFIFIFYFANSLPVMLVAQILEGIPWGVFIANSPAYCSEIVPIALRAPATQMLQMFWAIGAIIVQGVCYNYEGIDTQKAYRVPIALQWMFPTPLAILIYLAPESPWWLTRKGKFEAAARAVGRLGKKDPKTNHENVAMMRRTIELEANNSEPSLIELFQGVNLYRTLIVCGVYAAQNLTGNLIANQAVYFFRQAGIDVTLAFALGLITSALQMVFVMLSWVLTTYIGRRPIYVWGSAINTFLLIMLGVAASVPTPTDSAKTAASLAQASLGLIVSVLFTLGPAPVSYAIIGETSSIRLRPLTTGIGRGAYYVVNIPCIVLASWMLNPDGGNLGGKCGYVWGGTGFACFVVAWFFLPEYKGRSYRELDILFERKVNPRKWPQTVINIEEDH
ncbi:MFS transporter like protein [Zymoseptoria brevis]|uniref:MFS transporter like protein n=1 Tax=Zymoseptoria brevis TaxID=1047168 RepID=A0A0F4GHC7_9PEZI|nr:MFS transporter like protein [Zymoseptoria brevis]